VAAPRRNNSRANQPQPLPSWAPGALALSGLVAGVVIEVLGFPGVLAAWLLITVAAFASTPPNLTGKKDANGFPTPLGPRETNNQRKYRFWSDLKWRLLFPTDAFAVGWGVYAAWFFGAWAAVVVWCLPHSNLHNLAPLLRIVDAPFALVLVTTLAAARRKAVVAGDVSPGVRFPTKKTFAFKPIYPAIAVPAGLVGALTMFLVLPPTPVGAWTWIPLGFIGGAGAAVGPMWVKSSLAHWREVVAAREEWAPRWEMLKHDPAPRLVDREHIGPATIDTFDAAPQMGAMSYYALTPKIVPMMGAATRLAIMSVPSIDSQGQPQPGTRHPLRFQVVAWPGDELPNITDPSLDKEVVDLFLQVAMVWACDTTGFGRPILDEAVPLAITEPTSPAVDEAGNEVGPGTPGGPQAWATTWHLPDGPPIKYIRTQLGGAFAGEVGAEVLTDHRGGRVYIGDLTGGSTVFDPSTGVTEEMLKQLNTEDVWNGRWAEVLKQDVNPPTIEHSTYSEQALWNGKVIKRQAFVTLQGVDPMDFFGLEAKIAATLSAAPYVAVTGWAAQGRVGERHAQAFTVYWSSEALPPNPDNLAPAGGREEAARWLLAGRMNEAFKAARLSKPEIYDVKCMTQPRARQHIWKMSVRLYGGVTLADVRGAAQRLRQHLGSEWLRVTEAKDGCVIVAGVSPAKARLNDPQRDGRYLASLDWEQAFLDAKVSGVGGFTPSLLKVDRLPHNDQVQVLDFSLPTGLAFEDVKAARKNLESSSRNAFVDVRRAPSGLANEFRILASEVNPMPSRAPFDFAAADKGDWKIPFATNLFGEPTFYDNRLDAHLLISGVSGGGKSVTLQGLIYGALVRDWSLYVADPSKGAVDFNFSEPWAKAIAKTIWETKGMVGAIYEEVTRRKAINAQYNCGNYRDLPDEVRYNHVLIVLDEFTSMMMPEPVPKAMDDSPETLQGIESVKALNAAKAYIGTYVGKIVREARSTGFTLLLATQALKADTLSKIPGAGDLKDNMSRMIVGRASMGQLSAALKMWTEAPPQADVLPPGRGLYEGNGQTPQAVQCWFEGSQEVFAQNVATRREPLSLDEKLDMSRFVEPELEVDGARIDDGPVFEAPVFVRPATPVTAKEVDLGEIELSLDDLELTLDDLDSDDLDWSDTTPEAPSTAEVNPFDTASIADPEEDTAPFTHAFWDTIDPTPWLPEGESVFGFDEIDAMFAMIDTYPTVTTVTWESPELDKPSPLGGGTHREVIARLLAEQGVTLTRDSVAVVGPLDWDAVDPSSFTPAYSEYGWPEIDALLAFLDANPDVTIVTWNDAHLYDEDDLGIPFHEVVSDLLLERGTTLMWSTTTPPAAAADPAPVVTTQISEHDEFGPLPVVPAHLRPTDDDPFA
jgi:S-DNA-T family DNA segregation ATPase FtsK/SpoIIIE